MFISTKIQRGKTCPLWPLGQAPKTAPAAAAHCRALANLCCCSVKELTASVCSFQTAELPSWANPRRPLPLFPLCFLYLSVQDAVPVRREGQICIGSQDMHLPRASSASSLHRYQATLSYRHHPTRPSNLRQSCFLPCNGSSCCVSAAHVALTRTLMVIYI